MSQSGKTKADLWAKQVLRRELEADIDVYVLCFIDSPPHHTYPSRGSQAHRSNPGGPRAPGPLGLMVADATLLSRLP